MGVMNVTPNSFSDGGELSTPGKFLEKLARFGEIDFLDIGAESTAPASEPVGHSEEWQRMSAYLPILKSLPCAISIDTYHPETIFRVADLWLSEKVPTPLLWNDVSGKFDEDVDRFLSLRSDFRYVFCHNLAPIRELTSGHMDFTSEFQGEEFLDEVASYFRPYSSPRVIFDPCLGFSKTFEQNWTLIERFGDLQKKVRHPQWLLGFSRKSFIRKKLGLADLTPQTVERLDQYHADVLQGLVPGLQSDLIIRTHRPELVQPSP